MSATFCGYQWDNSGRELLGDSHCRVLQDYALSVDLAKLRLRIGLGYNARWLASIRDANPALIHAHFFNDGLEAIRLGKTLSIPVITTLHGHDITKSGISSSELSLFFEQVDCVIAVSEFIAEQALRRGCPPDKLVRHSIGIDSSRFDQAKQESKHPSLLFVGRLVEKKGCTYLLQAMHRLLPRYPELSLTLIGDGPLRQSLQDEADSLGLDVNFVGPQSAQQIREKLSQHWIFTAPSITADSGDAEGLGMVFLEAQAMSTPVVSFASGGVSEAVEDGVTGLLCDEKDVTSLANNIDRLLSDRTLRQSMGNSGRSRVQQQFNIHRQCEILETHYRELLDR